jgi:hypothetical protein
VSAFVAQTEIGWRKIDQKERGRAEAQGGRRMNAAPFDRASLDRSLDRTLGRLLAGVLTEPLTATELARHFKCHRAKAPIILKRIKGVRRVGKRWQVPVFRMPLPYLQRVGLMPSP